LTSDQPGLVTEPQDDKRDKIIAAQGRVIQDFESRFQQMEQRLEAATRAPGPTTEELDAEFWKNPTSRIRAEMQSAVKPLEEYVKRSRGETEYERLKNKFRHDPKYGPVIDKAEAYVDSLMQNQEPTEQNLRVILYGIRGAAEFGDIDGLSFRDDAVAQATSLGITPKPTPTEPRPVNQNIPPHLRPSAPPAPRGQEPVKQHRELTENERRLAREQGMTEEQYLNWLEVPPENVVTSDIGIKKEVK
jgi:hypothetical protein